MKKNDFPQAYEILEVSEEAESLQSFRFSGNLGALPGQFVMVWIPGVDEKPISVAYADEKEFRLVVSDIGPWSHAMCSLQMGDRVGIRGPYGSVFSWEKKERIVMVGGGFGVFPCYFAATQVLQDEGTIDFIVGARKKSLLPYGEEIQKLGENVQYLPCTDDGSFGFHGFTTTQLEEILQEKQVDRVMTCGPEIMMKKVALICSEKGIPCQVSVERWMKCGFGVCGNCCTDPSGDRMCQEGPIIPGEKALSYADFGNYHRNAGGCKI